MKKIVALVLILTGIGLMAFPHVQKQIYANQEQQLVQEFRELNQLLQSDERSKIEIANEDPNEAEPDKKASIPHNVVGLLHIDKINLTLPMLQGATEANLNIGAGILNETAPLGEIGNTGIAAHRAYKYGRLFNRLDEVKQGDEIVIETLDQKLVYRVFDTKLVLPDDMSVLEPSGDQSIITLITCEPMYNPTHRIIVHAKKVSEVASN